MLNMIIKLHWQKSEEKHTQNLFTLGIGLLAMNGRSVIIFTHYKCLWPEKTSCNWTGEYLVYNQLPLLWNIVFIHGRVNNDLHMVLA